MSRTRTNDSGDRMVSKDQTDSSSIDEGSCGGVLGRVGILKKGPWTSAEDAILVEYVKEHGEGNWNAVQKHTGLLRCGKSCRLRWANHLRPNLKKGAFTPAEERLIIELHAKLGNKWARMAALLPGRTDNEIKNYWNTRVKRLQRAGLPLYPPDVCLEELNDGQQNQNFSEWSGGDALHNDVSLTNNYDIPEVFFDNLEANHGPLSYAPASPNIYVSSMPTQALGSLKNFNSLPPTVNHARRNRESDALLPGFWGSDTNKLPSFDPAQIGSYKKVCRPFGPLFPYDATPNQNPTPFGDSITGSHAFPNGNFSPSRPLSEVVKLELPSLQVPKTVINSWGTCRPAPPSPPPLESINAYIQSPPAMQVQSKCYSPRNSGLLQEVIHESRAKNRTFDKSLSSSVVTTADGYGHSTMELYEAEWGDFGDPRSPLGCSTASVLSEHTPISGSSLDESPPVKALPDGGDKEISAQLDFPRGDALLDLDCFEQSSDYLVALLSEDFGSEYVASPTSALSQGWGFGSFTWNNMPAACQMSEPPSDNVYGTSE
ncbi:hypothetical protein AAC387_Pa01g1681 [Persea americana]